MCSGAGGLREAAAETALPEARLLLEGGAHGAPYDQAGPGRRPGAFRIIIKKKKINKNFKKKKHSESKFQIISI